MNKSFPGRYTKDNRKRKKHGLLVCARAIVRYFFVKLKDKWIGGKSIRNRKFVVYVATGIVVFAVLMTVVLAAGGKAASEPAVQTEFTLLSEDAVVTSFSEATVEPSTMQTTQPDVPTTPPDIPATSEATVEPTETPKQTEKRTAEPAETKTPEPTETPKPTETPEPEPSVSVEDCVSYFIVESDSYYNKLGFSSNHYEYTEDEKYILAQIIEIEARGQEYEGMVAVGNVVMNRVLNPNKFGNNITDVVVNTDEFPYEKYKDRVPSSEAICAANEVLDNEYWVVPQNVYYLNSGLAEGENWGSHTFYRKIDDQCFYTDDYSGRNTNDNIPDQIYKRVYKNAQYGCKIEDRVKRVQYMLNSLGYDVSADGVFGKGTDEALKQFQEAKGLEVDGVAGSATIKALIRAFGLDNYCDKYLTE